ncbi:hypothetical protein SDC9_186412 [bioreactor metagenome]|uniref:Uncharacterized protein n=1 Tax=bioreactor metagenome TaxID=1076179 RepID=A0A645HIV2_9ZZZZ
MAMDIDEPRRDQAAPHIRHPLGGFRGNAFLNAGDGSALNRHVRHSGKRGGRVHHLSVLQQKVIGFHGHCPPALVHSALPAIRSGTGGAAPKAFPR